MRPKGYHYIELLILGFYNQIKCYPYIADDIIKETEKALGHGIEHTNRLHTYITIIKPSFFFFARFFLFNIFYLYYFRSN